MLRAGARLWRGLASAQAGPSSRFGSSLAAISEKRDNLREGRGGRSSISGLRVTVFGATGFLGRYVVNALGQMGSQVIIPYRGTENSVQHLKTMGDLGKIGLVKFETLRDEAFLKSVISRSNVVINLVGRDHETRNFGFEELNVSFPATLARLSREAGVERFVHLSALGATPGATSTNLYTKHLGEKAVTAAFPGATVIKAAPMAGGEDRLTNSYARMAKTLPFVPLIDGGETRLQPVYVQDVALAVKAAVIDPAATGRTYHAAGPEVYTVKELVDLVFDTIREPLSALAVPAVAARLAAMPRELLVHRWRLPLPPWFDSMFTVDAINGLAVDKVLPPGALTIEALGITPRALTGLPIDHLRSYRAGGYDFGTQSGIVGGGMASEVRPPVYAGRTTERVRSN